MRYLEIIVEMSNSDEKLHEILLQEGLFDLAVNNYKTNDILLKLNVVEIFSKWGNANWNAKFLSEHSIIQTILKEAFDPQEEFYIKKYLAVLIARLVGKNVMKLTV